MNSPNEIQFSDVLSIPSNPEDLFTLLYPIGTGSFGKLYKAMHNSINQIFAIKIIDNTKDCLTNKKNISFNYQSIQQETSVMHLIQKNDYIVKYYGSYYSRKSNTDIFGLLVGFAISIIVKLYINHSNFLGAVFSTHHNTSNYAILIQVMGHFSIQYFKKIQIL